MENHKNDYVVRNDNEILNPSNDNEKHMRVSDHILNNQTVNANPNSSHVDHNGDENLFSFDLFSDEDSSSVNSSFEYDNDNWTWGWCWLEHKTGYRIKDMKKASKASYLFHFLGNFYINLERKHKEKDKVNENQTKSTQYKECVFELLENAKKNNMVMTEENLQILQSKIENLTMKFDEESVFKSSINILQILIKDNKENAKDFLRKSKNLSEEDLELMTRFLGHYTLEALIVHTLSFLFYSLECSSLIKVSHLIDHLEKGVRTQIKFARYKIDFEEKAFMNLEKKERDSQKVIRKADYPFGSGLVEFMEERGLISCYNDVHSQTQKLVKTKNNQYYIPKPIYAYCNFDVSLLPIKMNLPMVCKPLDWECVNYGKHSHYTMSDISGGYLSYPSGDLYDRYRLLSCSDTNNFNIYLLDSSLPFFCNVMNKLQNQPFKINTDFLSYIEEKEKDLVNNGLLMPKFLASISFSEASNLLRDHYLEVIGKTRKEKWLLPDYSQLLENVFKNIQQARYENLIINQAKAFSGYNFYLPAFLDFRGRIYRSGILNFHERDLARSLIVFSEPLSHSDPDFEEISISALCFHYKTFHYIKESLEFDENHIKKKGFNPFVAKHPFQFLSNLQNKLNEFPNLMPITQDASASAYQIMSYLLLNETMAIHTNLITSSQGKIHDIYHFMYEKLLFYLKDKLKDESSLLKTVLLRLDRKLVKSIFMPIIYGKTLMSTANDLRAHFSHTLKAKESFKVAKVCFSFFQDSYPEMDCLIRLIRNIGWIVSAKEKPVYYHSNYFMSLQDYMKMEPTHIWTYNRLHKKRRRVTLRVASDKRDRRKTEVSTFVNFIHQKDAQIAMSVVIQMIYLGAPIYTVHDNFITTANYSSQIPNAYTKVFIEMGPPLMMINHFIYYNLILFHNHELYSINEIEKIVIPTQVLEKILKTNIPSHVYKNPKMLETWNKKIANILLYYKQYSNTVRIDKGYSKNLSPQEGFHSHEQAWKSFKEGLERSLRSSFNYSVHY